LKKRENRENKESVYRRSEKSQTMCKAGFRYHEILFAEEEENTESVYSRKEKTPIYLKQDTVS